MERLEVDSKSNSEEEFFDCVGKFDCWHFAEIRSLPQHNA